MVETTKRSPLALGMDMDIPFDPAKQNVVGVGPESQGGHPFITGAYESAGKAQEDLAKSLESRFAQPNWLKVSAAFAKPQLGGFGASFGSAMNELGEQEEQRRAVMPTAAYMKAKIEAGKFAQAQRVVQQEKYDALRTTKPDPKTWTESEVQGVVKYDPASPLAETIKQETGISSTRAGTQSTVLGTTVKAQEAAMSSPLIKVDEFLPASFGENEKASREALINQLAATNKYKPEELQQYGYSQLLGMASALNNEYAGLITKDARAAGAVTTQNVADLQNLSTARHLASSEKMGKLLGLESGTSAVSALFGWVANGDEQSLSRLSKAARQLKEKDPSLYNDFVVLQKSLATNVQVAREGMQNPSVGSQTLLASAYPNVKMPQESIIKILDLMANSKTQQSQIARLRQETNEDPTKFENSEAVQRIQREADERKSQILGGSYIKDKSHVPTFYFPYYQSSDQKRSPANPAQPANKGASNADTIAEIEAAIARKEAAARQGAKP